MRLLSTVAAAAALLSTTAQAFKRHDGRLTHQFAERADSSSGLFTCSGGLLSFVAHPDDDLFFQSPRLLPFVSSSSCITTVFLTSGDAGLTNAYAEAREAGNEAAYAQMAGVTDSYTEVNATLGGATVIVRTLTQMPQVQKVYFRLPDGGMQGKGMAPSYTSLLQLYYGAIPSITSRYGTSTWTLDGLKTAMATIIAARAPDSIITLDYLSDIGAGDHPDHSTTARLTQDISSALSYPAPTGYMGYYITSFAPNVAGSDLTKKENAFFAYAPYDNLECQSLSDCQSTGRPDYYWLFRQYAVTADLAVKSAVLGGVTYNSTSTANSTVPSCSNLAQLSSAKASASSENSAYGQTASAAIDNKIDGYPGDYTAEWNTYYGVAGTVFNLSWSSAQTFDTVVLYDRPNTDDQITGATLRFSDGSSTTIGALYNDGSASVFTFAQTTSTYISMLVNSVSFTSSSVGLAEFQVYLSTCGNASSTANWKYADVALLATATASSQSYGQEADSAVDGVASGYPTDYTKEWASYYEGAGAMLLLTWDEPYTLYSAALYDRPNPSDQVTGGTLTFDDGTVINVPSLANDGSATSVNWTTPISTSSLLFTVTSVSSTTGSVGLAEFMAFGIASSQANSTYPDIALLADASASSEAYGQEASKAIDSYATGYPTDYTKEWATKSVLHLEELYQTKLICIAPARSKTGATLTLQWDQSYDIYSAAFYDRPNLNDQVTGGTLTFSDGTVIDVPSLNNDGTATSVNWTEAINANSVVFTVTSTSDSTNSVGLAELMLFGLPADSSNSTSGAQWPDIALLAEATSSSHAWGQGPSNAIDSYATGYPTDYTKEWATDNEQAGATLTLNWTNAYTIYSAAFYDRPNLNDQITGGTLTFSDGSIVQVPSLKNDGSATSVNWSQPINASSVVFAITSTSSSTVNAGLAELMLFGELAGDTVGSGTGTQYPDVAPLANATASSSASQQGPGKAIDTVVDGYPGDYTKEWSTNGELAGATLTLVWSRPYTIYSVALYDRPNLYDQVTGGRLQFSDGTVVPFGALPNDGSAKSINFTAVTTTSLKFIVTSVSSSTGSIGLAEIMAFGLPAAATSSSGASSLPGPTASMASYSSVATRLSSAGSITASGRSSGSYYSASSPSPYVSASAAASAASKSIASSQVQSASSIASRFASQTSQISASMAASSAQSFSRISRASASAAASSASSAVSSAPSASISGSSAFGYYSQGQALPSIIGNASSLFSASVGSSTSALPSQSSIASLSGASNSVAGYSSAAPSASVLVSSAAASPATASSQFASYVSSALSRSASSSALVQSLLSSAAASSAKPSATSASASSMQSQAHSSLAAASSSIASTTPSSTSSSIAYSSAAASKPAATSSSSTTPAMSSYSSQSPTKLLVTSSSAVASSSLTTTSSSSSSTSYSKSSSTLTSTTTSSTPTTSSTSSSSKLATTSTSSTKTSSSSTKTSSVATSGTLAPTAMSSFTASSYKSAAYKPDNAFDSDFSSSWVSSGTTKQWIQVNFDETETVYSVLLYGVTSVTNMILTGTLTFSDGSTVLTGPVLSTGLATPVLFTARNTDWIKFTVTAVGPLTSSVGLTEMQVLSY